MVGKSRATHPWKIPCKNYIYFESFPSLIRRLASTVHLSNSISLTLPCSSDLQEKICQSTNILVSLDAQVQTRRVTTVFTFTLTLTLLDRNLEPRAKSINTYNWILNSWSAIRDVGNRLHKYPSAWFENH